MSPFTHCSPTGTVSVSVSASNVDLLYSLFQAVEDPITEDSAYNSFQYWRVPLPELDLSLLEDANDHSQTEKRSNVKDSNSDAMET